MSELDHQHELDVGSEDLDNKRSGLKTSLTLRLRLECKKSKKK